jgi:hypothetical protein
MKSLEMEQLLESFSKIAFGRSRHSDICVSCGSDKTTANDFRDDISRREYKISFMCQNCQDLVFTDPDS